MRRFVTACAVLASAALGVAPTLGAAPASAQPAAHAAARAEMSAEPPKTLARLDQLALAPKVLTANDQTLTITGKITNTSDRAIHDVEVRLQEDKPLTSEAQLRRAVGPNPADSPSSRRFALVTDTLEPGQSANVTIAAPLNNGPDALRMPTPGVYPLLVNVNGVPDYGGQSRVATSSMLIPVLGTKDAPPPPAPGGPAGVTMLWPLVDRPHLMPRQNGQIVLADDDLSTALAPGGRLSNLVGAVEQQAAAGSPLSTGLCFAIDPDLVLTVSEMSGGYLVQNGDQLVPGRAAPVARLWLNRLRGIVQGRCVLALPLADADLVALSQAKLTGLTTGAFTDGDAVIRTLLKVQPVEPRAVWPVDGAVDEATLSDLTSKNGVRTLLLGAQGLAGGEAPRGGPIPLTGGNGAVALQTDPMLDAAFASSEPNQLTAQNVLGALAFRTAFDPSAPRSPVLIAPPRQWAGSLEELTGSLALWTQLQAAGDVQPLSLADALKLPAQASSKVSYQAQAAVGRLSPPRPIPPTITARVARTSNSAGSLMQAMTKEDKGQADPDTLVQPVQESLLRASSVAWRPDNAAANRGVDIAVAELDYLRSQVFLASPSGPLNMASTDSPIPLTIQNNLPVTMTVLVNIAPTPGLKLSETRLWKIPPNGQRSIRVLGQILRSGRFAVDVGLSTGGGLTLGHQVRLEINSSAYGLTTLILTITAGVALLLLSGRRIVRRLSGARKRAREPKPDGTGGRGTTENPKSGDSTESSGPQPGDTGAQPSTETDQQPAVTAHNKGFDQP